MAKAQTWLVAPDTHFPIHDPAAFDCLLGAVEVVKPDGFLHLGDVGEWETVSFWKYKKKKRPPLEYVLEDLNKNELPQTNHCLDVLDAALDSAGVATRVVTLGNHDEWLTAFVEEHPYLADQYLPHKAMKLNERRWIWTPDGEYIKVGGSKLHAYHGGHYAGKYHAHRHAEMLGASVIYGHVHDQQKAVIQRLDGTHAAWSMGCLCKLEKKFLKGRPTNWSHNFGIVTVESDGNFSVDVIDIINGACRVWGQRVAA